MNQYIELFPCVKFSISANDSQIKKRICDHKYFKQFNSSNPKQLKIMLCYVNNLSESVYRERSPCVKFSISANDSYNKKRMYDYKYFNNFNTSNPKQFLLQKRGTCLSLFSL